MHSLRREPESNMEKRPTEDKARSHMHVGALVVAMWLIGVAGVVVAFVAFDGGQFAGAGLGLLASAMAFGQLLNAYVRR